MRAASRGSLRSGARREARPIPTVAGNMACRMLGWRVSAVIVAGVAAAGACCGVSKVIKFFSSFLTNFFIFATMGLSEIFFFLGDYDAWDDDNQNLFKM